MSSFTTDYKNYDTIYIHRIPLKLIKEIVKQNDGVIMDIKGAKTASVQIGNVRIVFFSETVD